MKIQNIQSNSFQHRGPKYHRLSGTMLKDVQELLYKMNHDTVYEESANGNAFKTKIMSAVNIDKKAYFYDKRFLLGPVEKTRNLKQPDCSIEYG